MKYKIEQIVGKVESGHLEPNEAVNELLTLTDVSQKRELLIAELKEWDLGYTSFNNLEENLAEKLLKAIYNR